MAAINPEISICGSILIDARCLPEVTAVVSEGDFSLEICRAVYHAAVTLDAEGIPVDPASILDACAKAGTPVSSDFLMGCMETTGTAANAGLYAGLLREASLRRSLSTLAADLSNRARNGEDPKVTLDYLAETMKAIEASDTAAELRATQDSVLDFLDYREKLDSGKSSGFAPSGLKPLDKLLGGGLLCGGLYVIGARPGMGKTTLGLWIADAVKRPVLFVSLEMGEREITAIYLSIK